MQQTAIIVADVQDAHDKQGSAPGFIGRHSQLNIIQMPPPDLLGTERLTNEDPTGKLMVLGLL